MTPFGSTQQTLLPLKERLATLLEGRKSRDKFNAKFWGELRTLCDECAAADPDNLEFVELVVPSPYSYSRRPPHVLTQIIQLVVKLKHLKHLKHFYYVVDHVALTEDNEAQLIGRVGPYIPNTETAN
jgi:hypothetical protein